jgi:hypothetical protein
MRPGLANSSKSFSLILEPNYVQFSMPGRVKGFFAYRYVIMSKRGGDYNGCSKETRHNLSLLVPNR